MSTAEATIQAQTAPTVLVGVTDHLDPELQAMLLAKYSRSYGSILGKIPESLEDAANVKIRLKETYVNYGHRSVGQLGHTTIFFEGISMLAALAIEVTELFNGQESSTRFIPYGEQPAISFGDPLLIKWQETWRAFYKDALEETVPELMKRYPRENYPEASEGTYKRTINARAFDICGGILPAGFTTCVGFTGSFDVLNEHLIWMMAHPLGEVRSLAVMAAEKLNEKYPNAGYSVEKMQERAQHLLYDGLHSESHIDSYYYREGSFEYKNMQLHSNRERLLMLESIHGRNIFGQAHYSIRADMSHFEHRSHLTVQPMHSDERSSFENVNVHQYFEKRLMKFNGATRSIYQNFPRFTSNLLRFRVTSQMDLRSYRDIHRHRNGARPLPMLTMDRGLHCYYVDNLNSFLAKIFMDLFEQQKFEFKQALDAAPTEVSKEAMRLLQQYAIPMAAQIPYYYKCDLNQLIYLMERRSTLDVHQTCRIESMAMYDQFKAMYPKVKVHCNTSADNWILKRGDQTFEEVDMPSGNTTLQLGSQAPTETKS